MRLGASGRGEGWERGKGAMRLGGDGVRISRKGIVRARGVCGMERRRVRRGHRVWRGDVQSGANGAGCAEACCRRVPGRGGGAGLGLGGSVSHGSERLELVVEWTSDSVGCRIGAGLIGCNQ